MRMFKVYYAGISKNNTNRVWGYLLDENDSSFGRTAEYHIFWGFRDGRIFFRRFINDRTFHKAKSKKVKRYEPINDYTHIEAEFSHQKLVRKLKHG